MTFLSVDIDPSAAVEAGTKFDQVATEGQKVIDSMKWAGS
jgi:hypothetical protein